MTFEQAFAEMDDDELTRRVELLEQGNRCNSCGNCERCWATWAPRPVSVVEYTRGLFARLKAKAEGTGGEG